ncbi:MAG: ATP-binding protein [Candidatus Delongbacteria bacterium]
MIFTILRQLTHSELGMFHEYRRLGNEISKQRAVNFDWDVVDRVFPSAKDTDRIFINCRCMDDESTVVEREQWLKRQDKNWRLEGWCPKNKYFGFVKPGVLFAMIVDSSHTPATASWMVIPMDHPASDAIVSHGESARLNQSGMIALYGEEGRFTRGILGKHFPNLFTRIETMNSTTTDVNGMEPDPVDLFDILARAGHQLPSAVADLIDNSISAGASEINITFPNPNQGGRWMCIHDNGCGMTSEQLSVAMRIKKRGQYEGSDLGKYGYGLKGASWSQADCLTVVTKALGGSLVHMTWDRDHLVKTRKWDVLTTPVEQKFSEVTLIQENGTAVLLTKMRPPIEMPIAKGIDPYSFELTKIREHLELVFHRYLEGMICGREKLEIKLNGNPLVPNNPMGHPLTKAYDPKTIKLNEKTPENTANISVRCFITPNEVEFQTYHASESAEAFRDARDRISLYGRWNETQGLFFYRLDRLIKWGGWEGIFAVDEKTKLLRVSVDFDRKSDDLLKVDISKQIIQLPVSVSEHIRDIVKEPRAEARTRYAKSKKLSVKAEPTENPKDGSTSEPINQPGKPEEGLSPKSPKKTKPSKAEKSAIRLVETGDQPWERKSGFTGEQVEVTPMIPALVELVRLIDDDNTAKFALSQFLLVLEQAGVMKLLNDHV